MLVIGVKCSLHEDKTSRQHNQFHHFHPETSSIFLSLAPNVDLSPMPFVQDQNMLHNSADYLISRSKYFCCLVQFFLLLQCFQVLNILLPNGINNNYFIIFFIFFWCTYVLPKEIQKAFHLLPPNLRMTKVSLV